MNIPETTVKKKISIIIPFYNEKENVSLIHAELKRVFASLPYSYEIIFVDDGSTDASGAIIETLIQKDPSVRLVEFSRNFGKEIATTAGFHQAVGDAAIAIDCDLQHPPEIIPKFIEKWNQGAEVVVGIRKESESDLWIKRMGSKIFYAIMNVISDTPIIPHSTDFRLIDRAVLDEFNKISERNRITRGLIDWLGFRREYVFFEARERKYGEAAYNVISLVKLALTGFITQSLFPLRFAGYAGVLIMLASGALGTIMFIDRFFIDWGFHFSGPAILAVILLFLVGFILICIGLLAFYIGNIHENTRHRPLYIIRKKDKE